MALRNSISHLNFPLMLICAGSVIENPAGTATRPQLFEGEMNGRGFARELGRTFPIFARTRTRTRRRRNKLHQVL